MRLQDVATGTERETEANEKDAPEPSTPPIDKDVTESVNAALHDVEEEISNPIEP
jgi:hypothetical protein